MDTKMIGRWAYIIGVVLAIVGAFVTSLQSEFMATVVIFLGMLAGFFGKASGDAKRAVIFYLGLHFTYAAFSEFMFLGEYFTTFFGAYLAFLGPVVLTAIFVYSFKMFKE